MSEELGQSMTMSDDPRVLARRVALDAADEEDQVGDFVTSLELDDHVVDFRFVCLIRGYEGWQWSVTLYHDEERGIWSVDESSLIPTDRALRPPPWVPWKDRLRASDLSVTDSIGTEPDDERLEGGFHPTAQAASEEPSDSDETMDDLDHVVQEFALSRRYVLSKLGRSQTAKRWYEGPHGPKSLSTRTADGNVCANCGFFIPVQGELGTMFGVCANMWGPDDGRVVSMDHGCGEHSEIEPPEPTHLWEQSEPAFDDVHIDVVAQSHKEERGAVELLELLAEQTDPVDDDHDKGTRAESE